MKRAFPFLCLAAVVALGLVMVRRSAAQLSTVVHLPAIFTERGFEANPLSEPFTFVTDIANAGDDRLFIAERSGLIKVRQADGTISTFLDIQDIVKSDGGETGLFGLAFHQDYASNGYFYVSYFGTEGGNGLHVTRFSVSAEPNTADKSSAERQITVPMEAEFHNGGGLRFNPVDGHLYLSVGDDFNTGNAQDNDSLKGKLLRFNPETTALEVWATGLRNPWRIGVDPVNGDIFVGDVGDRDWEEINLVPNGVRGLNYGWPCFEGSEEKLDCNNPERFVAPIHEYDHQAGCSITGGEVTRINGQRVYFFSDLCITEIQTLRVIDGVWTAQTEGALPSEAGILVTFGRDHNGTIFAGTENNVLELYLPR